VKIHIGAGSRIGYLSAAPRVSTLDDAEASGPRSHVLGVIHAFEELGCKVERFIVGDRMPARVRARSEMALRNAAWRTAAADVARIALGAINARRAATALRGRVDVVYERLASLQSLGWALQRTGVPWIVETSSPIFYEAQAERRSLVLQGLARRRELAAYHQCDAIVCVSRDLRNLLVEAGVDRAKIIVVPNGVDVRVFDAARFPAAARTFDELTIGFVGAMIEWQGLGELLRAVRAARDLGYPTAVALAGDGPDRASLEQLAGELRIAPHVRFVGRLHGSEVPEFLAGIDVGYSGQRVLQIGRMYHSPLKLYEYLAMGKPVIASDFDDSRTTTRADTTGFLFPAGDVASLTQAIVRVHGARGRLAEIADVARADIVKEHSWVARVNAVIAALAE
jgi:glycosyltransferase involved in cell wall biosynthesis